MKTSFIAFFLLSALFIMSCSKKATIAEMRHQAYYTAYVEITAKEGLTLCDIPDYTTKSSEGFIIEPTTSNDGSWRAVIRVTNCPNGKTALARLIMNWNEKKQEFEANNLLGVIIEWE